jgi:hypothetical protein
LPYGFGFLADVLARHGDRAAALATLREGLETAAATGEHIWDVEFHRLTGTVLLAEDKLDEAQASLQQAIRIAQAQQAKSLELRRCSTSWRELLIRVVRMTASPGRRNNPPARTRMSVQGRLEPLVRGRGRPRGIGSMAAMFLVARLINIRTPVRQPNATGERTTRM